MTIRAARFYHQQDGVDALVTLGHEFSGTIAEVGDNSHLTPDQNFIGLAWSGDDLAEQIAVDELVARDFGSEVLHHCDDE